MSIPESRVEAILSNILGEDYEIKLGKSRVEDLLIALGSYVANTPQLDDDGLIPLSYIPKDAFQDCITVQDDTARFALTTDDVQNGDCVYVNSTQIMYFVVDDTKLDLAAGYKALAAGIAAQAVSDKDGNQIDTTYATKNELSGKQDAIDSSHKLDADLVDDSSATHKFATSAQLSQIATNQSNIDGQQNATSSGGNGYAIINGIRLYVASSAPTGNIPDGSVGVGW